MQLAHNQQLISAILTNKQGGQIPAVENVIKNKESQVTRADNYNKIGTSIQEQINRDSVKNQKLMNQENEKKLYNTEENYLEKSTKADSTNEFQLFSELNKNKEHISSNKNVGVKTALNKQEADENLDSKPHYDNIAISIEQLKQDAERLNQLNFDNIKKKTNVNNSYNDNNNSLNKVSFEDKQKQFSSFEFHNLTSTDASKSNSDTLNTNTQFPVLQNSKKENQIISKEVKNFDFSLSPLKNNKILSDLSAIIPQPSDQSLEIHIKDSILENFYSTEKEVSPDLIKAPQTQNFSIPLTRLSVPEKTNYIDMSCGIQLSARRRENLEAQTTQFNNTSPFMKLLENKNSTTPNGLNNTSAFDNWKAYKETLSNNTHNNANNNIANNRTQKLLQFDLAKASSDQASNFLKSLMKEKAEPQRPSVNTQKFNENQMLQYSEGFQFKPEVERRSRSPFQRTLGRMEDVPLQNNQSRDIFKSPQPVTKGQIVTNSLSKARETYKAQNRNTRETVETEAQISPRKIRDLGAAREFAKNFRIKLNKLVYAAENNLFDKSIIAEISQLAKEYHDNKNFLAENDYVILRNLGALAIKKFGGDKFDLGSTPISQNGARSLSSNSRVKVRPSENAGENIIENPMKVQNARKVSPEPEGKVLKKSQGKNKGKAGILSNINSDYSKALKKFCKGQVPKQEPMKQSGLKTANNIQNIVSSSKNTNENNEKELMESLNL